MFSLKAHRKKRNNIPKRVQKSSRRGLPKTSSKNLRSKRKTKSNKSLKMWKKGGSPVTDSDVFEELDDNVWKELLLKNKLVNHFRTSTRGLGAITTDDVLRFYDDCPPGSTDSKNWKVSTKENSENNFTIKIELNVRDYAKLTGFFNYLLVTVKKSIFNEKKEVRLEKPDPITVDWKN